MSREKGLLSIGEMSRLTGASLRSLRYYEKLGILIPAHVSTDSGYRYYSFDQTYKVWMIMFCIELDMPLKEFDKFTDEDSIMNYRAFLTQGREIAEGKLKALKRGLKLIDEIEQQMDFVDSHHVGEIYTRKLPEMYLNIKPCGSPLKGIDLLDVYDAFSDIPYSDNNFNKLTEYGWLCMCTQNKADYYAFVEVPRRMAKSGSIKIPAGTYMCRQSEDTQIEQVSQVFKKHLKDMDSYIAIEVEVFTGKHKINKPLNELRVITLEKQFVTNVMIFPYTASLSCREKAPLLLFPDTH